MPLEWKTTPCEMQCLRTAVDKTDETRSVTPRLENGRITTILHYVQQPSQIVRAPHTHYQLSHPAYRAYNARISSCWPRKAWIDKLRETLTSHGIAEERRFFVPASSQARVSARNRVLRPWLVRMCSCNTYAAKRQLGKQAKQWDSGLFLNAHTQIHRGWR